MHSELKTSPRGSKASRLQGIALLASIAVLASGSAASAASRVDNASQVADVSNLIQEVSPDGSRPDALKATGPNEVTTQSAKTTQGRTDISLDPDAPTEYLPKLGNEAISISLPTGLDLGAGVPSGGTVVFKDEESDVSMAIQSVDGGAKFYSVIESASSPHEFSYPVNLPSGSRVDEYEDDSMSFFNADGELIASVAQPWAVDASGRHLPTTLSWDGQAITQVVSVDDPKSVTYPIVADPYMGKALFNKFYYEPRHPSYGNQGRYSASKTDFGQRVHNGSEAGLVPGQGIMRNQGWAEWTSRWPSLNNRATFYQQYSCHVLGGFGNAAGPAWDLEAFRSDNDKWLLGAPTHRCNWTF